MNNEEEDDKEIKGIRDIFEENGQKDFKIKTLIRDYLAIHIKAIINSLLIYIPIIIFIFILNSKSNYSSKTTQIIFNILVTLLILICLEILYNSIKCNVSRIISYITCWKLDKIYDIYKRNKTAVESDFGMMSLLLSAETYLGKEIELVGKNEIKIISKGCRDLINFGYIVFTKFDMENKNV